MIGLACGVMVSMVVAAPDGGPYTLFHPAPEASPIEPDRPNRATGPHTVDPGHVQFEVGLADYTYDRNKYQGADTREQTLDLGPAEVRLGLMDRVEFDLFVTPLELERDKDLGTGDKSHASGFGDLGIGAKINLWGNGGGEAWSTGLALQPVVKLPTAREELGNKHVEYALGVPFMVTMPAGFSLSLEPTIGSERSSANSGRVTAGSFAAALSYGVTEDLSVYVEHWMHATTERHQEGQQTFDFGAVYAITPRVAVDAGFSVGLNRATPDFEVTVGVSFKY